MSTLEENPLFICGMPRSGTTLLMSLLDGHPELLVNAGESRFFTSFWPRSHKMLGETKISLAEQVLLHCFRGVYHQKYLVHIDYNLMRTAFFNRLNQTSKSDSDYFTSSVLAYGEVAGLLTEHTKYWVDKTPWTERFTEQIFSWWPRAKCIHIIRDPRDTYVSWRTRAQRAERLLGLDSFMYSWLITSRRLNSNLSKYGANSYLPIRYEDLVLTPHKVLNQIVDFLGIQENSGLYLPTKSAGETHWLGNAADNQQYEHIDKSLVGKWRKVETINPKDFALLETVLREDMLQHRYSPEMQSQTLPGWKRLYYSTLVAARIVRDRGQY